MTEPLTFKNYCKQRRTDVDHTLERAIPAKQSTPSSLAEAMHYALFNGGKRLRPLIIYAAGELLHIKPDRLHSSAAAIELIHAYSLVHDDLPAMDDDDFRRGKPSCHKAFTEATAILVGDALQTLAFETLATDTTLSADTKIQLIQCLSHAAGNKGMVLGQAHDCQAQADNTTSDIEAIHLLKTGALFSAALVMPYLCSDSQDESLKHTLKKLGLNLGLAYQIQDDIEDLNQANDQAKPQTTLANEQKLQTLQQQVIQTITQLPGNTQPLTHLIQMIFKNR